MSGSCHCQAEKTNPRSLAISLYPPRIRSLSPSQSLQQTPEEAVVVSAGLQGTLYSTLRTGTMKVFFPLSGGHTGGKDTEVISGSHHYWEGWGKRQSYKGVRSSLPAHLTPTHCGYTVGRGWLQEPGITMLSTFPDGDGALRPMSPDHKEDAHLTRE